MKTFILSFLSFFFLLTNLSGQTTAFDNLNANPSTNKAITWTSSNWGNGFGHRIVNSDPGGYTLLNFQGRHNTTTWSNIMNITTDGKVGIGTSNPLHKLHVEGTINGVLRHKNGYFTLFPYNSSYDDGSYAKTFYDGNRKQIRLWNSDANTNFTRLETGGLSIGSPNPVSSTNGFENKIEFINGGHGAIVFHPGGADELMFGMHQNGNFYWGRGRSHAQNPSDYSMYHNGINGDLGIRGKLTSNEVKVKAGGWADYVFKKNYDLPSLEQVEKHIKEKGHLINIPSAKEVSENGIQLGEMNKLLLEKIEELTLYTLEQEEKLRKQEKKLVEFEKKLNQLLETNK